MNCPSCGSEAYARRIEVLEAENAELASDVKAGAGMLARATDRINDLEAEIARLSNHVPHGPLETLGKAEREAGGI